MVKYFLAVLIVLGIIPVHGQKMAEGTLGSWHLVSVTARVSDRFSINTSVQARYYEQLKNFNQFVLRSGINYHFGPNLIGNFGYAFIATDTTFEDQSDEIYKKDHSFGESISVKDQWGKFDIEHRFWLEHRFLEGNERNVLHRARYRLQLNLPLTKILFLNFHEEVFLNLQDRVWGQNRLYGSLGVHVRNHLSLQAGYFRTYSNHMHLDRLRIALFYNPDFRK